MAEAHGAATPDARTRVLEAAARVYAEHGFHGATTRLVAEEAGVNEVTIFRLFGTKDALLEAAVHAHAERERPGALPAEPVDPARELTAWCARELARLRRSRDLLRQCFAESGEHPELVAHAAVGMEGAAAELSRYVARLRLRGLAPARVDLAAAQAMLMSVIFADALGRDEIRRVYSTPRERAPGRYVEVFLAALGVEAAEGG